jgi:3-hydroxyisobutyrate dehydrogenase
MVKDIRTAQELARQTGTPVPLSDEVVNRWVEAQQSLPPGSDHTALAKHLQQTIGTSLERG